MSPSAQRSPHDRIPCVVPRQSGRPARHLVWVLGLALLVVTDASARELGVVEKVVDGDTLRVRLEHGAGVTVRLLGIDTPELPRAGRSVDWFAHEARQMASDLVLGRCVRLVTDELAADRDDYNRLLRYVEASDACTAAVAPPPEIDRERLEGSLNAELLRRGGAYLLARFPFGRREEFERLEAEARRLGAGLWSCGGLSELAWIEAADPGTTIQLVPTGNRAWAIRYGSWVKPHVAPTRLQRDLTALRRHITERSGAALDAGLESSGYRRAPLGGSACP